MIAPDEGSLRASSISLHGCGQLGYCGSTDGYMSGVGTDAANQAGEAATAYLSKGDVKKLFDGVWGSLGTLAAAVPSPWGFILKAVLEKVGGSVDSVIDYGRRAMEMGGAYLPATVVSKYMDWFYNNRLEIAKAAAKDRICFSITDNHAEWAYALVSKIPGCDSLSELNVKDQNRLANMCYNAAIASGAKPRDAAMVGYFMTNGQPGATRDDTNAAIYAALIAPGVSYTNAYAIGAAWLAAVKKEGGAVYGAAAFKDIADAAGVSLNVNSGGGGAGVGVLVAGALGLFLLAKR